MNPISQWLIAAIALLHLYFLLLEMFFWDKPLGMRVFGLDAQTAATSKVLAANQGLYNGFLSAGLIWGLSSPAMGMALCIFFLSCILIAGIYGGATANRRIWLIQALPAAIALLLLGFDAR